MSFPCCDVMSVGSIGSNCWWRGEAAPNVRGILNRTPRGDITPIPSLRIFLVFTNHRHSPPLSQVCNGGQEETSAAGKGGASQSRRKRGDMTQPVIGICVLQALPQLRREDVLTEDASRWRGQREWSLHDGDAWRE